MTTSRLPLPLRVPLYRSVLEALCLYVVLLLAGAALNGFAAGAGAWPQVVLVALAWIALAGWPAWRIRRIGPVPRRRARAGRGAGRALLAVALLTAAAAAVNGVLGWLTSAWPFGGFDLSKTPAVILTLAFGFVCARIAVLTGAWVVRKMEQRLRWELMASHVATIVLTFAALTALGSTAGATIVLHSAQPNAAEMARSVRDDLQLTGHPMDPGEAHHVFTAIIGGRLPQKGQPILSSVFGNAGIPLGVGLFDPGGRFLAGAERSGPLRARTWRDIPILAPDAWKQLRAAAAGSSSVAVHTHVPGAAPNEVGELAEAPVLGANGRMEGMVVVLASGPNLDTAQFARAAIVFFGASTVALIAAASLPLLLLSFLFSYLVARGLTRRLEAVSRVAAAVAAGDFTERATVGSQNEVGRLADDINRMAEHQERMVTELRAARIEAEEALRTRRRLIADVSHELRTPLAILRAHLESIGLRSAVTAGRGRPSEITVPADALDALEGETRRLESLIEDLFALSRVEEGNLEIACEPVDVAAAVDDVAGVMRPLAQRESAVTLSTDVPPGLPLVMADPERLRQILSNLVRNAIRHTPEGGIVVLAPRAEGATVAIAVADTGEGIAPEHLPHLFDRFYRADDSRTRETGGAGLGLAIVRELVELMGGGVSVESHVGGGSRFTVRLPVA